MLYGLIAVFAVAALELVFHHVERMAWAKERQKLLDRVQAHSLGEYKAYVQDERQTGDSKRPADEPDLV